MDAAFAAPGGVSWNRVANALTWYRRFMLLAGAVPAAAIGSAVVLVWIGPWAIAVWLAAMAAVLVGGWFSATRVRRSWGYAEGQTDFYLTYGVVVRQLIVVPYGRMQLVDVTANLLEQALGVATLRVHTAATSADARVPGLPLAEATVLRDRLAARSETFSTGL